MNKLFNQILMMSICVQISCFWPVDLTSYGYGQCESKSDCEGGRYCIDGRCSESDWVLSSYPERYHVRALGIADESSSERPAAYAIRIGDGLDISSQDYLGARWVSGGETPVLLEQFTERYPNQLVVWVRPNEKSRQGIADVGYIYTKSKTGDDAGLGESTQPLFDGRMNDWLLNDGVTIDPERFRLSPGADAEVIDGHIRLEAGEDFYWRQPISDPSVASIQFQLSGADCDRVFIGFVGRVGGGQFEPYAHLGLNRSQSTDFYCFPCENKSSGIDTGGTGIIDGGIAFPNILDEHWLRLVRNQGDVALYIDDELWYQSTANNDAERFGIDIAGEPIDVFMTVQIDSGTCFLDIMDGWLLANQTNEQDLEISGPIQRF